MSDKPKSVIDKIKSSPAAKQYKEEGPMKVAKTLGRFAKEGLEDMADKVMDTILPLDNDHQLTRQEHFKKSTEISVHPNDAAHAQDIVHTYASKRMNAAPFRDENVSSITNAFENRLKKSPPDGY